MKKHFVVGVLGLAAAMMVTFPVSAHHRFGAYGDGSHDCNITPDHFCAIARGVCDGAGYCMDDHTRGYCNQSCLAPQTTYVPSQTSSQVTQEAPVTAVTPQEAPATPAAPQEAPATPAAPQEAPATPAAPQEAPVTQEVPAAPQEAQVTQKVPQTQTAPQTNSWYGGGGHHRSGHHGHHGCY